MTGHFKFSCHSSDLILLYDVIATNFHNFSPAVSPGCLASGLLAGSGCCTSGSSACSVVGGSNGICYCDVMCHADHNCCDDIQQLNCLRKFHTKTYNFSLSDFFLATNCEEAGKLNCEVNVNPANQELCNVTTPQGPCYCDANCMATGSPGDCCADALPIQISADGTIATGNQYVVHVRCLAILIGVHGTHLLTIEECIDM